MPRTSAVRRAFRAGSVLSLVGLLSLATTLVATAEPVYPSKAQVDRARAAVAGTTGQVATLDAQYVAASAQLSQVQDRAATAAEAFNGARVALDLRAAESAAAQKRAAAAQGIADSASLEVRRYAASVYQQGGSFGELEAYLDSDGPQEMIDKATALEAVGDARARSLQRADATSIVAVTMRRQAVKAQAAQTRAAQSAESARNAAQSRADDAQAAAGVTGHPARVAPQDLGRARAPAAGRPHRRRRRAHSRGRGGQAGPPGAGAGPDGPERGRQEGCPAGGSPRCRRGCAPARCRGGRREGR